MKLHNFKQFTNESRVGMDGMVFNRTSDETDEQFAIHYINNALNGLSLYSLDKSKYNKQALDSCKKVLTATELYVHDKELKKYISKSVDKFVDSISSQKDIDEDIVNSIAKKVRNNGTKM